MGMKGCPYASTHTAQNSPRYAKFNSPSEAGPMANAPTPVLPQPQPARRANALLIKDPSPPRTPPQSESPVEAPKTPVSRGHAMEIVTPKSSTKDRKTPSPPGSRLGRWMKTSETQ